MSGSNPPEAGLLERCPKKGNELNFDWPAKMPNCDFRMSALNHALGRRSSSFPTTMSRAGSTRKLSRYT